MNLTEFIPRVIEYLNSVDLSGVPAWQNERPFQVSGLAQGEYNMNYRLSQAGLEWVLRVNVGTQIGRPDQITYEYRALRLLEASGITPRPYFLDDSRNYLPYGVLIMAYLPGESLDYRRDLEAAACLFARLHTWPVEASCNHLIRERQPLSMMFAECSQLLGVYLESDLADPAIRDYLAEVLAWADGARQREAYFLEDPCPAIINTEVNSGNFIANRASGSLHLVDWEKPLWGDPSQDLSHFCVPTTTLWKTDYRMTAANRRRFMDAYRAALPAGPLRDTIEERVGLRDPFNCLRGISWSAMAWVTYQSGAHVLKNADTFRKINAYLEPDFLHGLFDAYLKRP